MTDDTPPEVPEHLLSVPEKGLTAAGGWCAPSSLLYGGHDLNAAPLLAFPEVQFLRPGTPEYAARQEQVAQEHAEHQAALAAMPPPPAPIGHVWLAYRDLSYEGDEVLGISTTREGARAVCERHAAAERKARPLTWDAERLDDDYCEGHGSGNHYYVTREDLLP